MIPRIKPLQLENKKATASFLQASCPRIFSIESKMLVVAGTPDQCTLSKTHRDAIIFPLVLRDNLKESA